MAPAAPCKEPACESRTAAFRAVMSAAAAQQPARPGPLCPPDIDELGRHSWTLVRAPRAGSRLRPSRTSDTARPTDAARPRAQLHTIAAYYPDKPTAPEKSAALGFLRAFPTLYPCKDCAHDMAAVMEEMPPRVDSRAAFSIWMCELHNHVNEKVGKPTFRCSLTELDEAWRTPSKACEAAQAGAASKPAPS